VRGFVNRQHVSGFTLIELAVVLMVSGILMAAYMDASRLALENKRRNVTMERIDLIQDAMAHYFARYGAYPCPGPPVSAGPDDLKAGNCASLDDADIAEAEEHGIAFINSRAGRKIIEGAVPYRLLDIPRENTLDGWNNQLTYAITAGLTSHDTFNANDGGISIVDEYDTSLINPPASALWALVSHGPDGSGAWYDGAPSARSCPSGRMETINCNHEGRFVVAPTSTAVNQNTYDDIVFYRAWVDYLPGSAQAYCPMPLQKGSSQKNKAPAMVQDGAMIQVCGDAARALNENGPACQLLICRGGRLVPGVIDLTATGGN
jgi:prepilin-type N-terminal cleavage/methylation domain-containing protein